MSNILESHYDGALDTIQQLKLKIKDRQIVSVDAICENGCMESYPCRGHDGVRIMFNDGPMLEYACNSVAIGAVQYWADKMSKNTHFSGYVDDELKNKIDKLR